MKQLQNVLTPLLVVALFLSSFSFGPREQEQVNITLDYALRTYLCYVYAILWNYSYFSSCGLWRCADKSLLLILLIASPFCPWGLPQIIRDGRVIVEGLSFNSRWNGICLFLVITNKNPMIFSTYKSITKWYLVLGRILNIVRIKSVH